MNVTVEELSSIKRKLTVELPEEEGQKTRRKCLDDYVLKARLKGFRPGKAPRGLVARIYGKELRDEVLDKLVLETVPQALKDRQMEPVGPWKLGDEVAYENEVPVRFAVTVELKPVFESPSWHGLELQRLAGGVTEEMVDQKLEELRLSLATVKKVEEDRPLRLDDLARVSYLGYDGGREVPELSGGPYDVELKDDPALVGGFVNGLLGLKAGETRDITVNVPGDARNPKLAGKTLILKTTVAEIRQRELPALDDELAKDLGFDGLDTLAALKEEIRRDLGRKLDDRNERLLNEQVTKALADLVRIELPTAMVEREISGKLEGMRRNLVDSGLDLNEFNLNEAKLREGFRPRAEKNVTAALVLDQIARDRNIEIGPEDIEAELAEMSADYNRPVEALRSYYQTNGLMDNLREGLRVARTLDLIRAEATITEVEQIDPARLGYWAPPGTEYVPGDETAPEVAAAESAGPESGPADNSQTDNGPADNG
ncbi:MAG: trigger factor [Candidatus Adiutrix sp.]|jgi:trigger factor|nr:trigger factor [Candidatus Adiutrix sp.]